MIKRGKMSSRGVEVLDTTTVIIVTQPCSCHPGPLLCLCCFFFCYWGNIWQLWKWKISFGNALRPNYVGVSKKVHSVQFYSLNRCATVKVCKQQCHAEECQNRSKLSAKASPFPSAQVPKASTRVFRLDGITCFHWSCAKSFAREYTVMSLHLN